MVWFRADDDFSHHPKVMAIPARYRNEACGLWVRAGTWAARYGTDGFVPRDIVRGLDPRERIAGRLVEAGLWALDERPGQTGYSFHQWAERQPSAAETTAKRQQNANRQRRLRERRNGLPPTPPTTPIVDDTPAEQDGHQHEDRQVCSPEPARHASRNALRNGGTNGTPYPYPTTSTYVSTTGGGSIRANEDRHALAQTAHSPAAHRLVEDYAGTCNRRPPAKILAKLAREIDGLIAQDWTPPEITRAVTAWGDKGLDPASLHSVANEVANARPAAAGTRRNGPATADDKIAALQALKTGTDGALAPLRAITGGRSANA